MDETSRARAGVAPSPAGVAPSPAGVAPSPWRDLAEQTVVVGGRVLRLVRPRDSLALLDENRFERDEFLPYWAQLWPSALALARAVSAVPLRGARTLELGCGLALPSVAAALAGGRVLATDWSADAVAFAATNATRNGVAISTAVCSWTEPAAIVARAPWDLVLASDVLYEPRNVDLLLGLLPRLVDGAGQVWIADPGRPHAEAFLAAAAADWTWSSTPDRRLAGVRVHRLRRR